MAGQSQLDFGHLVNQLPSQCNIEAVASHAPGPDVICVMAALCACDQVSEEFTSSHCNACLIVLVAVSGVHNLMICELNCWIFKTKRKCKTYVNMEATLLCIRFH